MEYEHTTHKYIYISALGKRKNGEKMTDFASSFKILYGLQTGAQFFGSYCSIKMEAFSACWNVDSLILLCNFLKIVEMCFINCKGKGISNFQLRHGLAVTRKEMC